MKNVTSDYLAYREAHGEEPGAAFGCVMGYRDWREIVCRLDGRLFGCSVGKIGPVHVALDRSMQPSDSRWYFDRAGWENHVARIDQGT